MELWNLFPKKTVNITYVINEFKKKYVSLQR